MQTRLVLHISTTPGNRFETRIDQRHGRYLVVRVAQDTGGRGEDVVSFTGPMARPDAQECADDLNRQVGRAMARRDALLHPGSDVPAPLRREMAADAAALFGD